MDETDRGSDLDWILAERLTELPPKIAERLIDEYWDELRQSAYYVKVALHVASPRLLDKVARAVVDSNDAKLLFEHLSLCWGLRFEGRRGVTRLSQMNGILPYLEHLSEIDIQMLWDSCNKNGWFEWRRKHLDSRAKAMGVRFVDDHAATRELDRELDREGPLFSMDQWGEMFLETGVSIEHMMTVLEDWVAQQDRERALFMAAALVASFGNRRHAKLLHRHILAESQFGRTVIRDADFEVRLRSLH